MTWTSWPISTWTTAEPVSWQRGSIRVRAISAFSRISSMIWTASGFRSVFLAARIAPSTSSGRKCAASIASCATAAVTCSAVISLMPGSVARERGLNHPALPWAGGQTLLSNFVPRSGCSSATISWPIARWTCNTFAAAANATFAWSTCTPPSGSEESPIKSPIAPIAEMLTPRLSAGVSRPTVTSAPEACTRIECAAREFAASAACEAVAARRRPGADRQADGGYCFDELGPVVMKGIPDPARLFRATRAVPA